MVDAAVNVEYLEDAERHGGVVGPRPGGAGGDARVFEDRVEVFRGEAGFAERVADGEPFERDPRPGHPFAGIGR